MTEIEASLVLNPLDGINRAVRIQLRGHFDVVDGADHNCIAGNGSTLANLNAGGFLKEYPAAYHKWQIAVSG